MFRFMCIQSLLNNYTCRPRIILHCILLLYICFIFFLLFMFISSCSVTAKHNKRIYNIIIYWRFHVERCHCLHAESSYARKEVGYQTCSEPGSNATIASLILVLLSFQMYYIGRSVPFCCNNQVL